MMGYRYRQLAGDLAAHQCAWQCRSEPLTVAITGSSGLIGSALTALLTSGGHRVIRLVRRAPAGDGERRWDPEDPDPGLLRGINALVHLAGASIAGRFSADHQRSIRASRITPTRRLAELAAATSGGPAVMVAASDIYYRALIDDTLAGPVNATSPHPVRGAEFAGVLAHVLRRPLQLPVPALGPRLLLGEQGASELAEADQRVSPRRLLRSGHRFRHPQLEQALRHLLGRAQPGSEDS
jgi:NAD dependent epimerase/dehydratase family enzyme